MRNVVSGGGFGSSKLQGVRSVSARSFNGFQAPRTALNGTATAIPATPLDIARAAALTCGPAPALSPLRRLTRLGAIVLELLAHLDIGPAGQVQVVGLEGLEQTAKSELSQRFGIGLARVVAEAAPIGLVDLYALDALSRTAAAPRVLRRGPTGRRPDFVGADASGTWSVVEAKARSAKGTLPGTRARVHAQAEAVDFEDLLGRLIPIDMRIGSVARLNAQGVEVWFEDPPEGTRERVYMADPDDLLYAYYEPVRDLVEVYGSRLRGVSGATGLGSAPLPGSGISLAVHRRILRALDDPAGLRGIREELQDDLSEYRWRAVEAEDRDLSIGLDGLGLLSEPEAIDPVTWFRELRES